MPGESQPSILASMQSWFTPTVLFILINIVVCIIFFSTPKKKDPRQPSRTSSIAESFRSFSLYRQNTQEMVPPLTSEIPRQLSLTSSFFESLRSFNLHRQNSYEVAPPVSAAPSQRTVEVSRQISRTSSIVESLRSFNIFRQNTQEMAPIVAQEPIEAVETVDHGVFTRNQSDTHPTVEGMPEVASELKKSASATAAAGHYGEEVFAGGAHRPSSVRERKVTKEADEEVDAKADNFIKRFREHLKLQRLDSIIRNKEMLNRGK